MPELPEVETIKEDLKNKILNQRISAVEVRKDKSVNFLVESFINVLNGNSISKIERRGKLMVFFLSEPRKIPAYKNPVSTILVHLKMTGQLIYKLRKQNDLEIVAGGHKLVQKDFDLPNSHTQIIFSFENGGKLYFNDLRRFGYMKLATDEDLLDVLSRYGIEPLSKEFNFKNFETALGKRKIKLKVGLMDQKKIAGIGNIYADEASFCAGVLPTRIISTLTKEEKKKLFNCIPKILKLAIKHRGTSFKDYIDSEGKKGKFLSFLKVYDREGQKCVRCGGVVKKVQSNGRGTHFCPDCQK